MFFGGTMRKNKKVFSTELSYVFGIIILALGTSFMEAADFGVSMIVAPAYLLHLKISEFLPFFSFGMAEYCIQGLLLVLTAIIARRFSVSYLFSFVTAVLYGLTLDGFMLLIGLLPPAGFAVSVVYYIVGLLLCTAGISFFFHTYISPEAYELFVIETANRFGININKVKLGFDASFLLLSILLSFVFFGFGHFEGVKLGTIISAFANGLLISVWTHIFEKIWRFEDKLPLRRIFRKES